MNWLAAVINRVSNASSVVGNALCPVCSQALTSASVVRSPNAMGSAFLQISRLGPLSAAPLIGIGAPPSSAGGDSIIFPPGATDFSLLAWLAATGQQSGRRGSVRDD